MFSVLAKVTLCFRIVYILSLVVIIYVPKAKFSGPLRLSTLHVRLRLFD